MTQKQKGFYLMTSKATVILSAFVPVFVFASPAPLDSLTRDEVAEADKKWGTVVTASGKTAEQTDLVVAHLERVTKLLNSCCEEDVLSRPDKLSRLWELYQVLSESIPSIPATIAASSVSDSDRRGYDRLNMLAQMSNTMCHGAHAEEGAFIKDIFDRRFVETTRKWILAVNGLESWRLTEDYKAIDAGYAKFMDSMDQIILNRVNEVSGNELMIYSGLQRFASSDGKPSASTDSNARIADKYLAVLRESEMSYMDINIKYFKERSQKLLGDIGNRFDWFQKGGICLYPADRELFRKYFQAWGRFMDVFDKSLLKKSEDAYKRATDSSGEVAKLRNCEGFSPNGAFAIAGSIQSNGCPGYARRIRRIFEECKSRYLKHQNNVNAGSSNPKNTSWN